MDYNTYREYNFEKSWTIDGDVLKGFTCTLWALERYATDEHAKDYPIEAANARKILDQIREEIATINGKDDGNMKTPRTATDYLDALNDIYVESRNIYTVLQNKADAARINMEQALAETQNTTGNEQQVAQLRYDIAKAEYRLAEDARRSEYRDMVSGHEKKVAELRTQFAAYLDNHYSASPDKLDTATMQLLESGICKPAELAHLVDRHQGNPTMLRIIGSYAKKLSDSGKSMSDHNKNLCLKITIAADAAKDGSRELAIFDSAVSAMKYGLAEDAKHAANMNKYVEGWVNDFKTNMENLPVAPEGTTEPDGEK